MFRLLNSSYYTSFAPADSGSGGAIAPVQSDMSKDDIYEYLTADDETPDDEKAIPLKDGKEEEKDEEDKKKVVKDLPEEDEDEESEEDEEDDELEALEEELEEPSEDKLELTTPVPKREILKKYPKLFKDFPHLEKAYYREQQFTEVFPTIPEAREASEKAQALDKYEDDLKKGNLETTLRIIHKESPDGFAKVVDDYMAALNAVDNKSYLHVFGNMIKNTILSMVNEARTSENKQLEAAAVLLNQFVFGNSRFENPTKLSQDKPEVNKEEENLKRQRQEFIQEKFNDANSGLNTKVQNSIRATIDANIDPKDSMGSYVKKAAIAEAFDATVALIDKDTRFKALIDRLWENAYRHSFNKDSMDKLRSAFMTKAKTILPATIKQARNNALKGIGKRVREDKDSDDREESRETSSPKNERRSAPTKDRERNTGRTTDPKKIPANMSTLDFLMQD